MTGSATPAAATVYARLHGGVRAASGAEGQRCWKGYAGSDLSRLHRSSVIGRSQQAMVTSTPSLRSNWTQEIRLSERLTRRTISRSIALHDGDVLGADDLDRLVVLQGEQQWEKGTEPACGTREPSGFADGSAGRRPP
ncbi:hypothetical protein SCALM49S_08234 [Streptomyces californicus]